MATKEQTFAIIETGSKQYKVTDGTILDIEKLEGDSKSSITFDKVLLIYDGKTTKIGQPYLEGASVSGTVLEQKRGPKEIVFKFKRKTGYKKTQGHRQSLTTIRIDSIGGKAKASTAKKATPKTAEKKETKTTKASEKKDA